VRKALVVRIVLMVAQVPLEHLESQEIVESQHTPGKLEGL
jgi:hypothetical protein